MSERKAEIFKESLLYFGNILEPLMVIFSIEKFSKFGDFGTFFPKKILCMMSSSTGFFWLPSDKNLPKKRKTLVETQLEAHTRGVWVDLVLILMANMRSHL